MSKVRKSTNKRPRTGDCLNCANCQYIGEGDYICDKHQELVMEEFSPADDFLCCGGKDWIKN